MREQIAAIVGAIQPHDALEANHIQDTLAWIATGAPLCRLYTPATPPRHLVSYFALLDPRRRQLLLVDHRKAGLWLPSGGHVEPGEHPRATVEREAAEELKLAARFWLPGPLFLTVTRTVGQTAGHTDVSLWYVLQGDCQQPLWYDGDEFARIAWFPLDALPLERGDPHLGRFSAKLAASLARGLQ
jgi:8-oxo-dGTP pyrophosphatase MutT (NUDIX family)